MDHKIMKCVDGDDFWPYIAEHSPRTIEWIKDREDAGDYHCFTAIDEKKKYLGLCVIDIGALAFGPLSESTVGFLEEVSVLEEFRRNGIGTALLRSALSLAWQQGAGYVSWVVEYKNDGGIALSQKAGAAFLPEEDAASGETEQFYVAVVVNPNRTSLTQP